MSNVNRLQPKAPKKDYFKWVDNQIQLRFNALMVTEKPEDIGRRFIITLFMNDDTVMVYEPQVRNSGIVSGKFLEKTKYKNKLAGGRFFQPQDFFIGQTVQINGYKFVVQEYDERTKKWIDENYTAATNSPGAAHHAAHGGEGHSGGAPQDDFVSNYYAKPAPSNPTRR